MEIAIIGASGYTGGELMRLLLHHPSADVVAATSRKLDGTPVASVHPHLRGLTDLVFRNTEAGDIDQNVQIPRVDTELLAETAIGWLKKNGLALKNGIASLSTVSRLLTRMDEELFLFNFIEWICGIVSSKGAHLAVDGKALRGAADGAQRRRSQQLGDVAD